MVHYDAKKRHSISAIIEILKSVRKCEEVLGKYVPVGRNVLKLKREADKAYFN